MDEYTLFNFTDLKIHLDSPLDGRDDGLLSVSHSRNILRLTCQNPGENESEWTSLLTLPKHLPTSPGPDGHSRWAELSVVVDSSNAHYESKGSQKKWFGAALACLPCMAERNARQPVMLKESHMEQEKQDRADGRSSHPPGVGKAPFLVFAKQESDTGEHKICVVPSRDSKSHLSTLPDDTLISDMLLPGTHESLALHGYLVSRCQDEDCTITVQLEEGIRFLDVRLGLRDGQLLAFHGSWPQQVSFKTVLQEISDFLKSNPRETVIMCVKEEAPSYHDFSQTARMEMDPFIKADEWFLEDFVPTLGQVRGKAILLSRFGGGVRRLDGGSDPWKMPVDPWRTEVRMGWRPNVWPNSSKEAFGWNCGQHRVSTQDWYDIGRYAYIPDKVELLFQHLLEGSQQPPTSRLTISFASGSSIPFALPVWVAKGWGCPQFVGWRGVNDLLRDRMLDHLETLTANGQQADKMNKEGVIQPMRLKGIVPLDFYRDSKIIDVMVAFNSLI